MSFEYLSPWFEINVIYLTVVSLYHLIFNFSWKSWKYNTRSHELVQIAQAQSSLQGSKAKSLELPTQENRAGSKE